MAITWLSDDGMQERQVSKFLDRWKKQENEFHAKTCEQMGVPCEQSINQDWIDAIHLATPMKLDEGVNWYKSFQFMGVLRKAIEEKCGEKRILLIFREPTKWKWIAKAAEGLNVRIRNIEVYGGTFKEAPLEATSPDKCKHVHRRFKKGKTIQIAKCPQEDARAIAEWALKGFWVKTQPMIAETPRVEQKREVRVPEVQAPARSETRNDTRREAPTRSMADQRMSTNSSGAMPPPTHQYSSSSSATSTRSMADQPMSMSSSERRPLPAQPGYSSRYERPTEIPREQRQRSVPMMEWNASRASRGSVEEQRTVVSRDRQRHSPNRRDQERSEAQHRHREPERRHGEKHHREEREGSREHAKAPRLTITKRVIQSLQSGPSNTTSSHHRTRERSPSVEILEGASGITGRREHQNEEAEIKTPGSEDENLGKWTEVIDIDNQDTLIAFLDMAIGEVHFILRETVSGKVTFHSKGKWNKVEYPQLVSFDQFKSMRKEVKERCEFLNRGIRRLQHVGLRQRLTTRLTKIGAEAKEASPQPIAIARPENTIETPPMSEEIRKLIEDARPAAWKHLKERAKEQQALDRATAHLQHLATDIEGLQAALDFSNRRVDGFQWRRNDNLRGYIRRMAANLVGDDMRQGQQVTWYSEDKKRPEGVREMTMAAQFFKKMVNFFEQRMERKPKSSHFFSIEAIGAKRVAKGQKPERISHVQHAMMICCTQGTLRLAHREGETSVMQITPDNIVLIPQSVQYWEMDFEGSDSLM